MGSGASSCPTHTKQGPQGRWEPGDPLLSPQCIQWALSSPINRLPGVRGIELPDLCLAGLPPLPPSWALWGQGLAGLLAPDSPCGCRGDRFRLGHSPSSCPSLPPWCSPQGWLLHRANQPPPPGAEQRPSWCPTSRAAQARCTSEADVKRAKMRQRGAGRDCLDTEVGGPGFERCSSTARLASTVPASGAHCQEAARRQGSAGPLAGMQTFARAHRRPCSREMGAAPAGLRSAVCCSEPAAAPKGRAPYM